MSQQKLKFKEWFNYTHVIAILFFLSIAIAFLYYLSSDNKYFFKELFWILMFWFIILSQKARTKRPLITHTEFRNSEELILTVINGNDHQFVESIALNDLFRVKLRPKSFWYVQDVVWLHTSKGVVKRYSFDKKLREEILPVLSAEKL